MIPSSVAIAASNNNNVHDVLHDNTSEIVKSCTEDPHIGNNVGDSTMPALAESENKIHVATDDNDVGGEVMSCTVT